VSGLLEALNAVADLDVELLALERSRGSLPARRELGALSERFAELERARLLLEPERAPLAASLQSLETEAAQLAERKAQVEARLASATGGGRELAQMHDEARHLAERLRALEDHELELMEALEPLEQRLGALRVEAAPMLQERDRLVRELEEEERGLDRLLEERRDERRANAANVEPSLLERYEKIAARSGGAGAARLEHQTCTGCHLALSAAEHDRLRHLATEEISTCEQCDRILIRPDQLSG
jgi:predicted  nucleic acid-binding Zn-ribbon protein